MIVYTYVEFGMNYLKKQMKYYTLFRVLRLEFASVYFAFDKTYISGNITHECIK